MKVKSKVTAPRKRSKSRNEMSDKQLDAMFGKIQKAPAWFTSRDDVLTFNKNIDEMQWVRRIAAVMLETSGKKLIQRVKKERDFAVTMVPWYERIGEHLKMLDDVKAMIGHAQARFMVAICARPDVDEVFAEGRKLNNESEAEETAVRH